ncbi:MAG TPA: glycoside hydrolase family 9 protein [Draconibacterium sp.]|nr:glycoside hydrolase family 9 protein [Draconibacterium sp.]
MELKNKKYGLLKNEIMLGYSNLKMVFLIAFLVFFHINLKAGGFIRINQLGYLPKSIKVAVFLSDQKLDILAFKVVNSASSEVVFEGKPQLSDATGWGMQTAYRLNFSQVELPGTYFIELGEEKSPAFRIDYDVFDGTADFVLNYIRQQRCGFNPYLNDSCHTHDGVIVDHPTKTGEKIDVTGGWHDASDYLQYSTTSINSVFQMMFAYQSFKGIFTDKFDKNGKAGSNEVPDILDEIRWGLDWMLKMNPAPGEMYNQIADDRDHVGFRLPNKDEADYGFGEYRPVYLVTGNPQGLAQYKNESTGVSSIAGKFASAFALGSELFKEIDLEQAELLKQKALKAWDFALSDIGFCQTACNVSPYFYEERNYVDDLELAAASLFNLTGDKSYLKEASKWGKDEAISPWIRTDTARHYESYPFINLGHYFLIKENMPEFADFYRQGLDLLYLRGKDDPFLNGLPYLWCSNNFVVAALTQAELYEKTTGDTSFSEMKAALRDWLFGCNPWGTAMICAMPGVVDSPLTPHSSYTVLLKEPTYGGLVDGPVYNSTYQSLIGITLTEEDEYAPFNKGKAVYHDDVGDYSTNEPTLDGTASLTYILAALQSEGKRQAAEKSSFKKDDLGAIIRVRPNEKSIYLTFTADSFFEGGEHVLNVLDENNIKASFFFTGNFLRNKNFESIIKRIISEGHYVGAHSDSHLLYAPWENRDSTLVTETEFVEDLQNNFRELERFGVSQEKASFFMPAYEWYNRDIVEWSEEMGLRVIGLTPGTGTNADYTTPDMSNYRSSDELFSHLKNFEQGNDLNGTILLIHPGTSAERQDKFYLKLNDVIHYFTDKGYAFQSFFINPEPAH